MRLLAPEEVFNTRNKKVLQAKEERSSTDRKRARRLKKKKQGVKQNFESLRSKVCLMNKKDIDGLKKVSTSTGGGKKQLSSSTKFFAKLQENNDKAKVVVANRKQKPKTAGIPGLAKKLKL